MPIKLIIGLQNPGSAYEQTRHNAGAWFVEQLSKHYTLPFNTEKKLHTALSTLSLNAHTCKIALPLIFMNQSGLPTRAISQFYRIQADEILVVHDELDLPPGRIKLKTGGGHGGHNGLRDIIAHLNSSAFHRLRIGIGHPGHKEMVLNYVLGKPNQADKEHIFAAIERGMGVLPLLLEGNMTQAMNTLNA